MKYVFFKFIFVALFLSLLSFSFADQIGMMTGSNNGTYIKFGRLIAVISEKEGVNVLVKESEGSFDSISKMLGKENAAFAIVQEDVLPFLRKRKDSIKKSKIKELEKLRMVFPFYNEEIHLFANKKIKKIDDLNGKRVVMGKKRVVL